MLHYSVAVLSDPAGIKSVILTG